MLSRKKPQAVIYVAETSCCGLVIHSPFESGKPAHVRPRSSGYESCNIVRYWEFAPKRQMTRKEILKAGEPAGARK